MQNNRDSVKLGNLVNVLGSGNASSDGGLIVIVGKRLSSNKLASSLGKSDHDGTSVFGGGLHTGVDGVSSNNVDSWDGEPLLLGVLKKINEGLSRDDTRLDGSGELGKGLMKKERNKMLVLLNIQ